MEIIALDNDITVFYITATSFPEGIREAHERLHSLVPFSKKRNYFGISRPEDGPIIYRAATEELQPGEGKDLGCDSLVIKKGKYISLLINDYTKDVLSIAKAFDKLLEHPGLDPQGYCVEWYSNSKEVQCMIRLGV